MIKAKVNENVVEIGVVEGTALDIMAECCMFVEAVSKEIEANTSLNGREILNLIGGALIRASARRCKHE